MARRIAVKRDPLRDPGRIVQVLSVVLALALVALLALAILDLDDTPGGLTERVAEQIDESGVNHPVTAVLLNFRAYDTWLEVAVLLLAAWGALVLRQSTSISEETTGPPAGSVLDWLIRILIPLAVITGVYLLWLGTDAPGGAFQAGAVIGAAAVLLRLSGYRSVSLMSAPALRSSLLAGFAGFLLIATVLFLFGWAFLEYPPAQAGLLILAVELLITWSVAVSFVALFAAARPQIERRADQAREGTES
jgi:multisubunit Na+/H+ antiporter MnhB subunit